LELREHAEGSEGLDESSVAIGQHTTDLYGFEMHLYAFCNEDGTADGVAAWNFKDEVESGYRVGDPHPSDFATFLTWRWGRYQTLPGGRPPLDHDTPNADLAAPVSEATLRTVRPEVAPAPAQFARKVRHPKFGEGIVLSEADGKCRVEFESGAKTLLASVLTFVE
jgi:hypothetical protein